MELELIRLYKKEKYTIGNILAEDEFICNSLEPPVRELVDLNNDGDFLDPGEGKIMKHTAIPEGRYKVELVYWAKHQKTVPILLKVPGFTGILIHAGKSISDVNDTEACIIPGENREPGKLLYSKLWARNITDMIRAVIVKGESVYITIK